MDPRWRPADPRRPRPYEHDQNLDRIVEHISSLFGFIPGVNNPHLRFNIMARLDTIRRAMDVDGQRYQEINSDCHHLRSEMEILRTERKILEGQRDRAEEDRDRFRADNKYYRDENCRLAGYSEKMLSDYNKLEQRYKRLEARQGSDQPPRVIAHAENARSSLPEEKVDVRSLQDRLDAAQESNDSLRKELLSATTAKDAFVAHLQLSEGRVDSLAKELVQVKTAQEERTNNHHGHSRQSSMVSSEELCRVKADLYQAQLDTAMKEKANVNLSTQLHLMVQASQQQEDKIPQSSRELEQAKKREIQLQGMVQRKDNQGEIRSLEDKVQKPQSQLDHKPQTLRDSDDVIKVIPLKRERSTNPAQVIQNLEQLEADLERKHSQARQGGILSIKAMQEYKEQSGYQPSEEESELKIKGLEAALEEMREKYNRIALPWQEYPYHERALVEAAASISQWRQDVELRMSTSACRRDSRAAR
ncbi:hypothetical protein BG003_005716 [Podila horticola]|nr:hypothetical protein BG003_005716 [Podila horticola]